MNQPPRGVIALIHLTKTKNLFRGGRTRGANCDGGGKKKKTREKKRKQSSIRTPPPRGRRSTTTVEAHATEYAEISASSRDTQPSTPRRTSGALTAALMGFFRRPVISSVNDNTNHIFVSHRDRVNGCYATDH